MLTPRKTRSKLPVIGTGEHQYEADHCWLQLPDQFTWQTTHNIAVDSAGLVYVIHEGRSDQVGHPAVFVFDSSGRYIRSFGSQFQGGGHGLDIRSEGSDEFLYVTAYQTKRSFAKLTLLGETVWKKFAPMESGIYTEGEDLDARTDSPWGRDRFLPTNIAFHPDGSFYMADGYGGYCIHHYDANGVWQCFFGKPAYDDNHGDGTFEIPHGLAVDSRGAEPLVVVADRGNSRLQWFTLEGQHRRTQDGFILPANVDVHDELLVVPDLMGRVTLINADNEVIAHLGDDSDRMQRDTTDWDIRRNPSQWQAGKFVHPHDACFDADGNIYVTEWVESGRITKLRRLP